MALKKGEAVMAIARVDQLRASVIWGMLAEGFSEEEILRLYPDLTSEELSQLVAYFWVDLGSGE